MGKRFTIAILSVLATICLWMAAGEFNKYKPTPTITLKNVKLYKLHDMKDSAYTKAMFKADDGEVYNLVIHDIYIEKDKVFEGNYYNVEYKERDWHRPDNFIQTIE